MGGDVSWFQCNWEQHGTAMMWHALASSGEGAFGSGAWRHHSPEWLLEWQTDNVHYVTDIDTPEDLSRWAVSRVTDHHRAFANANAFEAQNCPRFAN